MPEIHIAYDLPSFKYGFVWDGTEAEAARLLTELPCPPSGFIGAVVLGPKILRGRDKVAVRGAHAMLTAWALQQAAHHPECPGRVIDYLPTHDFEVVITAVDKQRGKIKAKLKARSREDFAGSA